MGVGGGGRRVRAARLRQRGQPIAISASENRILTMGSVDQMVLVDATSCVESKRDAVACVQVRLIPCSEP